MKKTVSLMLCLLLIFSSVNFAFADFGTSDSSNLSNLTTYTNTIKNALTNSNGAIYSTLNYISNRLLYNNKSAANWLSDIENHLATTLYQNDGNSDRSISWWVKEAVLDLDQLVGSGNGSVLNYLDNIYQRLVDIKNSSANIYTETHTIRTNIADLMENYISAMRNVQTFYIPKIYNDAHALSGTALGSAEFFSPFGTMQPWSFSYYSSDDLMSRYSRAFSQTLARMYAAQHQGLGSNMGSFNLYSQYANAFSQNYVSTDDILIKSFSNLSQSLGTITAGYLNTTKIVNWKTLTESSPVSVGVASMVENYLEAIQNPIARLAYVHASDEEIAAREKAATNQTAVVNNFIDSNGSGAAPASSFGSVASMSSGYTTNMNTDASASGIWNIFNSNNFGWFSQETANQLDTTVSTRKRSSDFETPLLDQQIAEIYKELGVDVND